MIFMVLRYKKKVRKMRGSKTHGYGAKKKHRGKGNHGGFGYAGSHKHKWSYIVKYEPDHFGKKRLAPLNKKIKIINLHELDKIAKEKGNDINLTKMGYDKLLGAGKISASVNIIVESWSKKAEEKIKNVGGSVKSPFNSEGE